MVAKWIVYKGVHDEIAGQAELETRQGAEEGVTHYRPHPLPAKGGCCHLQQTLTWLNHPGLVQYPAFLPPASRAVAAPGTGQEKGFLLSWAPVSAGRKGGQRQSPCSRTAGVGRGLGRLGAGNLMRPLSEQSDIMGEWSPQLNHQIKEVPFKVAAESGTAEDGQGLNAVTQAFKRLSGNREINSKLWP